MFTDLFSSLDGAVSMFMWFPSMVAPFFFLSYGINLSFFSAGVRQGLNSIWLTTSTSRFNVMGLFLSCLFLWLVVNNMLGLTPLIYTLTSDLIPMLGLSLLFWFLLLLSGVSYNFNKTMAHLAPSGAPLLLLPFLVIIETISILIRPITLAVRLIANISAGHIVLGLVANTLTTYFLAPMTVGLMLIMLAYMLFEFFVAFIQAYIFTLLVSLYQTEHPYSYSLKKNT